MRRRQRADVCCRGQARLQEVVRDGGLHVGVMLLIQLPAGAREDDPAGRCQIAREGRHPLGEAVLRHTHGIDHRACRTRPERHLIRCQRDVETVVWIPGVESAAIRWQCLIELPHRFACAREIGEREHARERLVREHVSNVLVNADLAEITAQCMTLPDPQ